MFENIWKLFETFETLKSADFCAGGSVFENNSCKYLETPETFENFEHFLKISEISKASRNLWFFDLFSF